MPEGMATAGDAPERMRDLYGLTPEAFIAARDTLVNLAWLDRTPDGIFQTAIVQFYEACVSPPLHSDRLLSRARVVRHALTHVESVHRDASRLQKRNGCCALPNPGDGAAASCCCSTSV